jgi:hypothetical protein
MYLNKKCMEFKCYLLLKSINIVVWIKKNALKTIYTAHKYRILYEQ